MKNFTLQLLLSALLLVGMIFTIAMTTSSVETPAKKMGFITGKITCTGKVPTMKPIDMSADKDCASMHSKPLYPEFLVLGDGNTLSNVFVRVKNAPAVRNPPPTKAAVIEMEGCMFVPHVLGVQVGQPLKFKNSDGILHNVHGLPKVNREFNIGMPPTVKEKEHSFSKPEPVFKVKCDVHPWMVSYVSVMTHPYFAVTGKDGSFKIDNLPDGTYEIEASHEKLGSQTKKVTTQGGRINVDFSFKMPTR